MNIRKGREPGNEAINCLLARIFFIASACSGLVLASSPGFSLLPRNSLRMTFDPPERKAEGEPGPFSHVIDDA